jgi:hypothetical protein
MGLGKPGLDNINRDDTKGASTLSRFLLIYFIEDMIMMLDLLTL